MKVVDASVWVSVLVTRDAHHGVSSQWLRQQLEDGELLVVPAMAIIEIAGAVARRTGDPGLGRRAVDRVRNMPILRIARLDERSILLAADLAADLRMRGADAVYVAIAHEFDVQLVTLDREQSERAATVVTVQPL